jgi:hypothetical protein
MNPRILTALLLVQSLLLTVLVGERLITPAHAADTMRCELTSWPSDTLEIKVDTFRPVAVNLQEWNTSSEVKVSVEGWNNSDEVRVRQP